MNRNFQFYTTVFIIFFAAIGAIAQPTIRVEDASTPANSNVTVDFTLDDIDNIMEIQFSVNWDINQLEYIEVASVNENLFSGISLADFDESDLANGNLVFHWEEDMPNSIGTFIQNGQLLFQLTFKTIGMEGDNIPLDVSNMPAPIIMIRDLGTGTTDLGDDTNVIGGTITLEEEIPDAFFSIEPTENYDLFCPGDIICYDLEVAGFDSLTSAQTTIQWDTSVIKFIEASNFTLLENETSFFVRFDTVSEEYSDFLRILLFDFSGATLFTVPDSTSLVTICYEVVGTPGTSSLIEFPENAAISTEVLSKEGTLIDPIILNEPVINVSDCASLIDFSIDCENVRTQDTICIDFKTTNFEDITKLKYTVTWDPEVLQFITTENFNLPELDAANFSSSNGLFTIDWEGNPASLPNGETIHSVCFKAIGEIDSTTELSFLNLAGVGFEVTRNGNESLTPEFIEGCEIRILPPIIDLEIPSLTAIPDQEFCIPINATNFLNVEHIEGPIEWDPTVLEFVGVQETNLPNLTIDNFDIRDADVGRLQLLSWDSTDPMGITLNDGESIFELCFKVIGELGDQSPVSLPSRNNNEFFIRNASNQDPPVNITDGVVTIETGGLILSSPMTTVNRNASFCVDVSVSNFQEIISIDYGHVYDENVLQFDSVQVSGVLTNLAQDNIVATEPGNIKVIWFTEDNNPSTSLPDETVLYSLCFTASDDLGACANFGIDTVEDIQTITTAGGESAGIFNNLGDICIDNFGLSLLDSTNASCIGADGALSLAVSGAPNESFFYNITRDDETFDDGTDGIVRNNEIILDNLIAGIYCINLVSIDDVSRNERQCFDLNVKPSDFPTVDVGEDIDAGCVEDGAILDIALDGSSFTLPQGTSGTVPRTWSTLGNGAIPDDEQNQDMATALFAGTYIFSVRINQTGCEASDTLEVFTTQPPRVQVQQGGVLGCVDTALTLGIEVLDQEDRFQFLWSTVNGNIVEGAETFTPIVNGEGFYTFTVTDTLNGCIGVDSTFVTVDTIKPNADAGLDLELRCEDTFIAITGVGSNGALVEWSTEDGSSIFYPNPADQSIANVTRVGTYIFTATNQVNGCEKTDTMTINADSSLPVARVKNTAVIGCDAEAVTLDGSNSSQGPSFSYNWLGPDGMTISDEDTINTNLPGEYSLIVTNIDNDQCSADTVQVMVSENKELPVTSITELLTLNCMSGCTPLSANVPDGDQFSFEWTTTDGLICGGENASTVMVQSIGVYTLMVTDNSNNCVGMAATIVQGDGTEITADPGPARQIDCVTALVTLDGRGSTSTATTIFSWTNEGGEEVSDQITAEVSEPGEYTLEIEDTSTGCMASGRITVSENMEVPTAEAGDAPNLTGCEFPSGQRLNGNESSQGDNFSYAWTSTSGNLVGDTTITAPQISGPGIFTLTVTDRSNGCVSTDEVLVLSDVVVPDANAGQNVLLDCDFPTATLAGLNELPGNGSEVLWTTIGGNILSPSDQLSIEVDAPGTYILTITSPDGCEDTDEVEVTADLDLPEANAGQTLEITCNQPITLNGSGATGDNINIEWTTLGGNILSGGNTYTPEVNRGGSYTLTVTNTENNCVATSLLLITDQGPLPEAIAGDNQEICINETTLNAIAPEGDFIGTWSSLENNMIINPTDATTSVADLVEGTNIFVWTLSSQECGVFSSDTLSVIVPAVPIAMDDIFELQGGEPFSPINVIENDQVNAINFNVNILTPPTTGELNAVDEGIFEFNAPMRYFGAQQFQYEICSQACSDLCGVASVRVIVLPGIGVDTTNRVPNAITPNGDGMNDMLLVDELIFDAIDFPKSEMVIFNRWGDVVFRASPYNNDWRGQATNGDELPEGTYYYVLRLDISEGEVMKGDVTILR